MLFLLNTLLGLAMMFVGICRLNRMTKATRVAVRTAYVGLLVAGGGAVLAPLAWQVPVNGPQVALMAATLWRLVVDIRRPA